MPRIPRGEMVGGIYHIINREKLATIRNSVNRQAPLGQEQWQVEIATKYGMLSTLNQRGRPKRDR
ncbi:MAG: hypothetical protein DRG78_22385 [Epsilonproteobacteria bacterium]|nr:MAG: hypothetical protein DRG78_22385 [Campylobacterota bacterium]